MESMEKLFGALEKSNLPGNTVKCLRQAVTEIESRRLSLDLAREAVAGRMMEIESLRQSLDKRSRDLEERERELDSVRERKKRKLILEVEALSFKREDILKDVRFKEEILAEELAAAGARVQLLDVAQTEVEGIRLQACEKLREIELEEERLRLAHESLKKREKKVNMIIGSLDERIRVIEERENEFDVYREAKMRELVSKEEELRMKREDFDNEVKLADEKFRELEKLRHFAEKEKEFKMFLEGKMRELVMKEERMSVKWEKFVKALKSADDKFREQENLRHGCIERLELADSKVEGLRVKIDERFKEIEVRENAVMKSWALSVEEADLVRELIEKQFEEFEKMRREFISFHKDKMRVLVSKEQQVSVMSSELVKVAKSTDQELTKREKLGHELTNRLELAYCKVVELRNAVEERAKQIGRKETELNSVTDWVEEKMDVVDCKGKELEEQDKRIKIKENDLASMEKELEEKKKELALKEKNLESWRKEVDNKKKDADAAQELNERRSADLEIKQKEADATQELNEQRTADLDWREKQLNSVKKFNGTCFKEHLAKMKQLRLERESFEKSVRDLETKEQQLENRERELDLKEKRMGDILKELESRSPDTLNAYVMIEPEESADIKLLLKMDGETLQMYLNDMELDLESMGEEIFKVLHLSSDPPKLVLDAMEGFYPPHLREADVEFNVRKTCILLLHQLIRMSREIQPCVREEALKLAREWKSKMRTPAENSLEVLGFLSLLAAYNLTCYFDKDQLLSLMQMVAQYGQTPELQVVMAS